MTTKRRGGRPLRVINSRDKGVKKKGGGGGKKKQKVGEGQWGVMGKGQPRKKVEVKPR